MKIEIQYIRSMNVKENIKKIILPTLLLCFSSTLIFATEIGSSNYKIVGATTKGGGIAETTDGDYASLLTIGYISNNPRNYSSSYALNNGPENGFIANVPSIACFETTTDGYSNCTTGPSALITGGMTAICGAGGCYNKGRFEITENSNPSDALYSIQISEDNFASDIRYIDGSTYTPETISTHNLSDYKTKTDWETETFNIQGLEASTQYYIRITALHGNFSESDFSQISNATTAVGTLTFDIDIADTTGLAAETSAPYSISFTGSTELIGGSAPITATNLIWIDSESNSEGGFAIITRGKNGGLYSPTTSQSITSATANLDSVIDGFGIQNYYIDYDDSNSELGSISAMTDYSGSGNSVGIISTSSTKIYEADGPVIDGRMALKVIARPGTSKTAASDYQEEIFVLFVPRY